MPPAGFEPAIPVSERPQTHDLDRSVTGIGCQFYIIKCNLSQLYAGIFSVFFVKKLHYTAVITASAGYSSIWVSPKYNSTTAKPPSQIFIEFKIFLKDS